MERESCKVSSKFVLSLRTNIEQPSFKVYIDRACSSSVEEFTGRYMGQKS